MQSIEAYAAFARMMEVRNFSSVGRQMGVSQSTVSKFIAGLEEELGVQLFTRTTRKISPTVEAARIYEAVQHMLEAVDTVRAVARGQRPEESGLLRLAIPVAFGRSRIFPLLPAFMERHPLISLDVVLTESVEDLVEERFELAITIDEPRSKTLISRSIRVFQQVVVAAPSYLAARGTPETPVDLETHDIIVSTKRGSTKLEFDSNDGRQIISLNGRLRTNSDEAALDAVIDGRGISIIPAWLIDDTIRPGAIRILLTESFLPVLTVSLVYPQTRFLSRRARCFIDFIIPELTRDSPAIR